MGGRFPCDCFDAIYEKRPWNELRFHPDQQDTDCRPWRTLLELIEEAAHDGREEFEPGQALGEDFAQIVTLPPSIARLKRVKRLRLYGSNLVRLPPQIGEMESLEEFDPYTSYRLHWFPFELTRCARLTGSRVSTRAVYGNYKLRPPFPRLGPGTPGPWEPGAPCSVCQEEVVEAELVQVWVTLWVGTDALPLLVNACSEACVERLPRMPEGYIRGPHRGGLQLEQPAPGHIRPRPSTG